MPPASLPSDDVDVVIIGAGAAGIAAAHRLLQLGHSVSVLEASHRTGGRAYTEELAPGVYFDLGCHWMHSASLNPFVAHADRLGFSYQDLPWDRTLFLQDRLATAEEKQDYIAFMDAAFEAIDREASDGRDVAAIDVTPRESRWTPLFDYWFSIINSADPDQGSVLDTLRYLDTGENWPLREGYGNLLARLADGLPVALNSAVSRVDASAGDIVVHGARGRVRARRAIVAVSTGILGAGDIAFTPELPAWKQAAIAALPLGNHNRIALMLEANVLGADCPRAATIVPAGGEPMAFQFRPFGYDYVVGFTGGRFATWLERAGSAAAVDLATSHLKSMFGNDIARHIVRHDVTAWGGDPWVRGAYSSLLPGGGDARAALARPLDERLFFAGEATQPQFFATCHGAWLSGERAADEAAASLGNRRAQSARSLQPGQSAAIASVSRQRPATVERT